MWAIYLGGICAAILYAFTAIVAAWIFVDLTFIDVPKKNRKFRLPQLTVALIGLIWPLFVLYCYVEHRVSEKRNFLFGKQTKV